MSSFLGELVDRIRRVIHPERDIVEAQTSHIEAQTSEVTESLEHMATAADPLRSLARRITVEVLRRRENGQNAAN